MVGKVTCFAGFILASEQIKSFVLFGLFVTKEKLNLQKLFSAFPGGWQGVGLLLLRVLIAVLVLAPTIAYVRAAETLAGWTIVVLLFASAACLLLGFVTPIAAALIGLTSLGLAFSTTPYSIQDLEILVLAIAIALLGPGAFSIDARMFGRREILIPVTRRQ